LFALTQAFWLANRLAGLAALLQPAIHCTTHLLADILDMKAPNSGSWSGL